jgi:hypothetical protein
MKQFLLFTGKIILVFLLVAILLDFLYTNIYEAASPRKKFQYFRTFNKHTLDYVFLGSSRVENSIIISEIEKRTGKKALNLGFQAAKLQDIYILLQLIKAYEIHAKKVFIQVDYIFNIEGGYSNVLQYEIMPYVRDNTVTKSYLDKNFDYPKLLYYFPFFRYSDFDSKIGFRELVMSIFAKNTTIQNTKGFIGLEGELKDSDCGLPSSINERNVYFDKINNFANNNNIEIVYYCSPMSLRTKNKDYIDKLKVKIPKLYDFSNVIIDDHLFIDCTHLNEKGAYSFTQYFIDNLLIHS